MKPLRMEILVFYCTLQFDKKNVQEKMQFLVYGDLGPAYYLHLCMCSFNRAIQSAELLTNLCTYFMLSPLRLMIPEHKGKISTSNLILSKLRVRLRNILKIKINIKNIKF